LFRKVQLNESEYVCGDPPTCVQALKYSSCELRLLESNVQVPEFPTILQTLASLKKEENSAFQAAFAF
jgi:hypothetical protein